MNNKNFDVVIVGLGPVGATLANLLAMNDLSVLILEKEAGLYDLPRAVHFDDEVMRVFNTIGIAKGLSKKLIINKCISKNGLEANMVVDAIYKSSKEKREVKL